MASSQRWSIILQNCTGLGPISRRDDYWTSHSIESVCWALVLPAARCNMGMDVCLNRSPMLLATSIQINAQARAPDEILPFKQETFFPIFNFYWLRSPHIVFSPLNKIKKSAHRMWRTWSFVFFFFFSFRPWEEKEGGLGGMGEEGEVRFCLMSFIERAQPSYSERKQTSHQTWIPERCKCTNSEFIILNMFRNKRLWKAEGVKVNCYPPLLTTLKKKKRLKKWRQGEGEDGRERKMEREAHEKKAEEKSWALFRLFFFFLSNGILCSWMCRCYGNCNLVTSLFLPNPALKLWLLHPFAWLPW